MISFYTVRDSYGEFCNFSAHGFVLNDVYWPTVEHYFQAQKFAGTEQEHKIQQARTPKDAKALGRSRAFPIRADWETVKDQVMYEAVLQKFRTHTDIRERLLNTGDEEIVENAPGDDYWGCGSDGTGRNQLGKTLMRVRSELRHP